MATSDLFPSWEHPGLDNSTKEQHSRFGNGSNAHTDQSLKGKQRNPSIRLKDPPLSSIYTSGPGIHKRVSSTDSSNLLLLKSDPMAHEMPRKNPPDPGYMRRKTEGDIPRRPKRRDASDYVFDTTPTSPMRVKSTATSASKQRAVAAGDPLLKLIGGVEDGVAAADRDSTTCEETQSISDNSSSLQSPASRSAVSSRGRGTMSGSVKRIAMPDESVASYTLDAAVPALKDPPIPRSVHSRSRSSLKDPPIPRSVHSRSSKRGGGGDADPPIPRSVEPRFDHGRGGGGGDYSSSRHSRRSIGRDHMEEQPPPLAPYEEDYMPPLRSNHRSSSNGHRYGEEEDYYGRLQRQSSGYHIHDDNHASNYHESRSRDRQLHSNMHDSSRHLNQHDRDREDRSRSYNVGGGYNNNRHHHHHHHHQHNDRYDDDNVSRLSRSSRYQDSRSAVSRLQVEDDVASRRSMPRRTFSGDRSLMDGGSRHSRQSKSSYNQDMSVSHPSRYEMDRATGYHHKQGRDRLSHHDQQHQHRCSSSHQHHHHHHHRGGGYDDERSRCSQSRGGGGYHHDERSRGYDERSRYHDRDDRSRSGGYDRTSRDYDERSRYQDREEERSRYRGGDDRSRYQYDRDDRSRYSHAGDDRSRYERDDRSRYERDDRSRYSRGGGGDDRSRYERDDRSRYERGDDRSRYERDDRSRYSRGDGGDDNRSRYADERSRYQNDRDRDRDDGSTIVTSYSRGNDRGYHESYGGQSYHRPSTGRSYHQHTDREEHYNNTASSRDGYPPRRDDRGGYGRSSVHSSRDEYRRRDRGYREEEEEDGYHRRRDEELQQRRLEEEGSRRSSSRHEDAPPRSNPPRDDGRCEAKMRTFGMCDETVKEIGGQQQGGKEGDVFVDIGFGTKAKLRRTKETMDAIARDYYAPAACLACSSDLFCIADVQYIVCPNCKTISPAEAACGEGGTATCFDSSARMRRHGVGLGFTYDTLFRMQSEVMQKRGEARAAAASGSAKIGY